MVFATIDDSNTQLGYVGDVSNAKGSYNDASVVTAKAVMDESREPADDSSESDEGGFDDFMAFLATPGPTSSPEASAPKKVVDNVARESESSDEEGGEWSSDEEQGTEAEDEVVPAPVPMMKAMSLGRGQMSANAVEEEATVKKYTSAVVTKPSRRESAPIVATNASRAEPRFELPKSASVATIHFAVQGLQNAAEIEAARTNTQTKEPMEPLPVDHFTKLGDAQMAAKAEESRQLSEAHMPIGTKYFTELAVVEKEKSLAEIRAVSESERSVATKYFMKLEAEKKASSQNGDDSEIMPAAIQKFTLEDRAIKEKKRAEIQAMRENPPAMPDGQAYFTNQMRAEKEKTRQELEELKNNPPPASVATEYFKIKESERQLEIDQMMNEPAPCAIEYFTNMANEENKKARAALEKANAEPYEPAVATKYFAELEEKKAAEIEAARVAVHSKAPMEPLPNDYFTKLGDEETAARAKASKDLAESQMPAAVRVFTKQAEEECESARALGVEEHEDMPEATKYFLRKGKEEEAAKSDAKAELMPAAIQKFTLEAREESQRKRAELESLRSNPAPIAPGITHFTPGIAAN